MAPISSQSHYRKGRAIQAPLSSYNPLGTANMVWAAHLGLVTGDWEYYGIIGGGLIAIQGALAASWLMFGKRPLAV